MKLYLTGFAFHLLTVVAMFVLAAFDQKIEWWILIPFAIGILFIALAFWQNRPSKTLPSIGPERFNERSK